MSTSVAQPVGEALIQEVVRRIAEAFRPEKVILFGSYAHGTPRPDSDVDLLVIMESDERPTQRSRRVADVCHPGTIAMDTWCARRRNWHSDCPSTTRSLKRSCRKAGCCMSVEYSREWVDKAEGDFAAALDLSRRRKRPLPDQVCFFSQQCAEK